MFKAWLRTNWWKLLALALILYSLIAGLLMEVPRLFILYESIRNLFFHVPLWFAMTFLLLVSAIFSARYLIRHILVDDGWAAASVQVALVFGTLGLLTGMVWARTTWGAWWVGDPKLLGSAVGLLLYCAYAVLRAAITETDRRARLAAVTNILFFFIFIPAIYIIPRMTDSLHPGSGGNPGFAVYDLDNKLRIVFYPAVVGWILLAVWLVQLLVRQRILHMELAERSQ